MSRCAHLWSLISVLPQHPAAFDLTYPMAPPNKKKTSKACFPHVCLALKLSWFFDSVVFKWVCALAFPSGKALLGQLISWPAVCRKLVATGGSLQPPWDQVEIAETGTHTHTTWVSFPAEWREPEKREERKKNKIKAFLKLILLLFLPSVACWRLLKSCCWAEQSQRLEPPICPQPCAAKIQESWFSLLLTFQPLYPPGFLRFTPLLFANVMNLKSALVLSVHSAVQLGCGSHLWGGWKSHLIMGC